MFSFCECCFWNYLLVLLLVVLLVISTLVIVNIFGFTWNYLHSLRSAFVGNRHIRRHIECSRVCCASQCTWIWFTNKKFLLFSSFRWKLFHVCVCVFGLFFIRFLRIYTAKTAKSIFVGVSFSTLFLLHINAELSASAFSYAHRLHSPSIVQNLSVLFFNFEVYFYVLLRACKMHNDHHRTLSN